MKNLIISLFFLKLFFYPLIAQAVPAGMTFQGRLVKDDIPVTGPVTLTLQVTSPNADICLLYEETHNITLSDEGLFSVKIGGGSRTINDEGLPLVNVFSNKNAAINGLICSGSIATSYTPAAGDTRDIYVSFVSGVDTVSFASPYKTESVPYALESERLSGKGASDFLQVNTNTTQSKVDALMDTTAYDELMDLLDGSSAQYLQSGAAITTASNFSQSGTSTFGTGTGAVSLNGPTTIAANQNFTMAAGTGVATQNYLGSASASTINANNLTSGSILSLSSNSSNAAPGNTGLNISVSGANATAAVTRQGTSSVVTSTGVGSTNIGGYFAASGGDNNYGLIVGSGYVGIGTSTPTTNLEVIGSANTTAIQSSGHSLTGANDQSLLNLIGTWNTTGTPTLIKANLTDTASNANSLLLDLQVGGVSKFKVDKAGKITGDGSGLTGIPTSSNSFIQNGNSFASDMILGTNDNQKLIFETNNTGRMAIGGTGSGGNISIGSIYPSTSANVSINGFDATSSLGSGNQIIAMRESVTGDSYMTMGVKGGVSAHSWLQAWKNPATAIPLVLNGSGGNVGIGTTNPTVKLQVTGAIVSDTNIIASGAAVNLALSNTHVLQNIGGSTITLSNMVNGGVYTLIMTDQTARTYTFSGCGTSKFSPANAATTANKDTLYGITTVYIGATWYCYITWSSGF